ncbi:MAG: class I tRNA ligase family protein [Candidatus Saccharimonadales bacterium]
MKRYNPKEIEPKWQQTWEKSGIYRATEDSDKPKRYVLEYFPYPSGAAMHVGHVRNYTIGDATARFHRMQGENVLHPMGWDSFGLPAENYAIKNNISPAQAIAENTAKFKQQLTQMGFSYDWSREIDSSYPEYYRWTQWFFKLLFDRGLAYQKDSLQWWCETDKTVLANEQVEAGKCWRCGNSVIKKPLKQWFFKITDYADRLADDLEKLDWSDSIKAMQRNWIGKSKGAEISFRVCHPEPAEGSGKNARSYIMGQKNITEEDIRGIGGIVDKVTDSGSLCATFPKSATQQFEALITEKMEPGFWNEYIGDEIVFIFKHKDGRIERFILSEETNDAIRKLGNAFNNQEDDPCVRVEDWLNNNEWYKDCILNQVQDDGKPIIRVFTTRPDTLFGATFMVLAPEHELVQKITTKDQKAAVETYIKQAQAKSDVERQETDREKTGVFTGAYAINPVNDEKIPVWIADYVLTGYGTGAIMAVPAQDERDNEFAKKFDLPIIQVVEPLYIQTTEPGKVRSDQPFVERQAITAIVKHWSEEKYLGLKWKKVDWDTFITGGVEEGQTPEEAAAREIKEETGYLHAKLVKRLSNTHAQFFHVPKDQNRFAHFSDFYFELEDDIREEMADEERQTHDIVWLSKEEMENFRLPESHRFIWNELQNGNQLFVGEGVLANSGDYSGLSSSEAREKIVADLAVKGVAEEKVNYKIRDWLISRQRYWGAPIPIIHCEEDGPVAVPEEQLPVKLPELTNFQPTGNGSALAGATDWINTICPKCGGPAQRETDTMDGFACSSWYFLRFADPHNNEAPFSKEKAKFWLPVDDYIGGAEHAVMHLLYARMWTKVLFDEGLIEFDEPFKALRNHGMILAPDGRKMSKSWGNVISPDEIIEQGYGADAIRLMELFIGPWNQEAAWSVEGMGGCFKFLQRVWTLAQEFIESEASNDQSSTTNDQLIRVTHQTIKKVSEDLHTMGFNTAIASLMAMTNELYKIKSEDSFADVENWGIALKTLTQLLAPFAPHISEELWSDLGEDGSVHTSGWPTPNETYLQSETMKIAVQVNGKVRATIELAADAPENTVTETAKQNEKVATYLSGSQLKKSIYIPGKIINFVI